MLDNIIQKFERLFYIYVPSIVIKDKNIIVKRNRQERVFEITKDYKKIKLSFSSRVMLYDAIYEFDDYFSAVKPVEIDGFLTVDYSKPIKHEVIGYNLHNMYCPSIIEPINISEQYLDFAQIKEDSIVIDLGAYSGLTSILFDRKISENNTNANGKVIAIEADKKNLFCLIKNFELYKNKTGRYINYLYSAISDKDGIIEFLSEGGMSSNSVTQNSILKLIRGGERIKVPSITLHSLAEKYNLDKIDFIKCDIEGAEKDIFEDEIFFEKYAPRIIVETHYASGIMTSEKVIEVLKKYNYKVSEFKQKSSQFPLLGFTKN